MSKYSYNFEIDATKTVEQANDLEKDIRAVGIAYETKAQGTPIIGIGMQTIGQRTYEVF